MVSAALMKPSTKGYQDYQAQLITERLTGNPTPHFVSEAMEWGTVTEPQARAAYDFQTGNDVAEVGFVRHHLIEMSGASPDGVIGSLSAKSFGLVEIKCPNTATHIRNVISEQPDKKYLDQMQWQMACTGADWCDFVSFDPRLPIDLQLFVKRIQRDADRIAGMEAGVTLFLEDTAALEANLCEKMREAA